ncbi:ABC transporter ATP-binding protein [Streptomyces sp. NPDC090499]|uniref:ABC transporter ATP-binding protein n=1 Tax=Streptomyces sp. NPDC090499 TaxID=3365965 RepID=UPI0037F231E6
MNEPLLSVRDMRVRYGQALALDGVSLDLEQGRVLAVLGPNGAGKSTLARAVSGLVPVASGSVRFGGSDITKQAAHRVRREGLVYLPEGSGVFPGLTVAENLRMAAALLPRGRRRAAVDEALQIFPALARRRGTRAGMLSGGERQMLSLSRGLVLSPKLIIADEMSLGLAPMMVDMVFGALDRLRGADVTIVLIEQFVHRALRFADDAVLLSRGRVAWRGPADSAQQEVLARYLGEAAVA